MAEANCTGGRLAGRAPVKGRSFEVGWFFAGRAFFDVRWLLGVLCETDAPGSSEEAVRATGNWAQPPVKTHVTQQITNDRSIRRLLANSTRSSSQQVVYQWMLRASVRSPEQTALQKLRNLAKGHALALFSSDYNRAKRGENLIRFSGWVEFDKLARDRLHCYEFRRSYPKFESFDVRHLVEAAGRG